MSISAITACFTGHRPDKIGGYNWNNALTIRIMKAVRKEVITLIEDKNVTKFYFGGALGIDQLSFAVVYKLKEEKYNHLELIIAVPFKNQFIKWNKEDTRRYKDQLSKATEIVYVDELEGTKYHCTLSGIGNYHRDKMQIRNEYMVDNSHYVIAVWDGTKGGTYNCVNYAMEIGKKINEELVVINPNNYKYEREK